MSRMIVNLIAAVLLIITSSIFAAEKLFSVIFEITINGSGEVVEAVVNKTIDPSISSTDAVKIDLPSKYVSAARKSLIGRTYNNLADGKTKIKYTWLYYDPKYPEKVDIE